MTDKNSGKTNENTYTDSISEAFATALKMTTETSSVIADSITGTAAVIGETVAPIVHRIVEQSTESVGKVVSPIANNPMVKYATKVPGVSWLMAALGQVDVEKVKREVAALRQEYPNETPEQLSQRVITEASVKAAQIGVITNFIPPLALTLLAVDLTAVAALQAGMIYRIAAIYGFPPEDSTRRGEVLAIWGLSAGGSGVLKSGLSIVELIPLIGTAVGATSNALLLYSLGHVARYFYETKLRSGTADSIAS